MCRLGQIASSVAIRFSHGESGGAVQSNGRWPLADLVAQKLAAVAVEDYGKAERLKEQIAALTSVLGGDAAGVWPPPPPAAGAPAPAASAGAELVASTARSPKNWPKSQTGIAMKTGSLPGCSEAGRRQKSFQNSRPFTFCSENGKWPRGV